MGSSAAGGRVGVTVGLAIAIAIALAAVGGIGVAASEYATIVGESPEECTPIDGGANQYFEFSVEYDLGTKNPDKINVMVKEEPYGEPTKVVDISDRSSRDTVTIGVEEYIDPGWDSITVKASVYAEGESVASGTDEVYYPVSGSGWTCDSDPERLSGQVVDGDGSDPPPGLVVVERSSDGSTTYQEYRTDDDCPGCFSFEDQAFLDPGDYRIHVYGSTSGYPPYWGYVDVSLLDGESEWVTFDRGGVYSTDLLVTDSSGSTTDLRFGPDEPIETRLDAQKPRHGQGVTIEVYTYEEGAERGTNPDAVYDPAHLSDGPNSFDFTFDPPSTTGTYEVDFLVVTEFEGGEYITDIVEGPTFEVRPYEPPSIDERTPETEAVAVSARETVEFSVAVSDPDTPSEDLSVIWTVDGEEVSSGLSASFDASSYAEGEHTVGVRVSDGTDRTADAESDWTVDVVAPPELETVRPGNADVTAGEETTFRAQATDPGGNTPLTYTWTIDGRTFEGSEVNHTFTDVGAHNVTVHVENTRGVRTERTLAVTVRNDEPSLERQSPAGEAAEVTAGQQLRFTVDTANADGSPVEVRLVVDGRTVDSEMVRSRSARTTLVHAFDEPGNRRVEVVAEDGHGATGTVSWDVAVTSRPPRFEEWSPERSAITDVQSGESVTFSAAATDPDGGAVTYEWFVDGDFVEGGTEFSERFARSGLYTVTVVATDEDGVTAERAWEVQVTSFRTTPRVTHHFTGEPELDGGSAEFFTVSFQNPDVNDRNAIIEIVVEVPRGITVSDARHVESGDRSQFRLSDTVPPGSQENLAIDLHVSDTNMVGETVEVAYEVIYYPEGNADDHEVVSERSADVKLGGGGPDDDGTDGGTSADPAAETPSDAPGFSIGIAMAVIGLVSILLRRRTDRD